MHHVTLDRAGADNGHFNHQIVIFFRSQARQHVDLGAGFHLEDTDAVAPPQHGIGGRVFLGNILHGKGGALFVADQIEGLANGREHAQGKHIHFHEAQAFQIILVPLDNRAVGHGGVFHRHQFGQGAGADHKAAHVLGQVAGKAQQGIDQGKELIGHFRVPCEMFIENLLAPVAGLVPPVDAVQ